LLKVKKIAMAHGLLTYSSRSGFSPSAAIFVFTAAAGTPWK